MGRIVHYNVQLFRRSDRNDIRISKIRDLKSYRVGGLIKDVKTDYLQQQGIDVVTYGDEESGVRMLLRGRLDFMPSDVESMAFRMKSLGQPHEAVTAAYHLDKISKPLYAAFQAQTDPKVVEAFRKALDEIGEVAPPVTDTIN